MIGMVPVLASTLGKIFQPLFQAMAWLIAFFYAGVHNYAIAIALLTVVVMVVTAPLTVKTTRSSVAMQALAPELKKLQAKYKGDKQKLNEEMMALYREHGVNPAGGCLPMLLQFPIFIILYDVIRGLTNTVKPGAVIHSQSIGSHVAKCFAKAGQVCSDPRYIGTSTRLYKDLVHGAGSMKAFGIDLAQKVFGHKTFGGAIPYILLVAIAIGLQYLQMRQLNSRNKAAMQANPQMQMMQRYMPLIFAFIYLNIAAGVNIYFIVSSLCRMGLQEYAFRNPKALPPVEGTRSGGGGGGAPRRKSFMERLADAQKNAIEAQQARQAALGGSDRPAVGPGTNKTGSTPRSGSKSPSTGEARNDRRDGDSAQTGKPDGQAAANRGNRGTTPTAPAAGRTAGGSTGPAAKGPVAKDGAKPGTNGARNRSNGAGTGNGSAGNGAEAPKAHPRSRAKRNRKAR